MLETSALEETVNINRTRDRGRYSSVLADKLVYSKICDIIGEALRSNGPIEAFEVRKHLVMDGFNLSYVQIEHTLEKSFKYTTYNKLVAKYKTRKPYGKHSTTRVWYIHDQESALEYYIKRVAYSPKV